jgi:hypothetical protein
LELVDKLVKDYDGMEKTTKEYMTKLASKYWFKRYGNNFYRQSSENQRNTIESLYAVLKEEKLID